MVLPWNDSCTGTPFIRGCCPVEAVMVSCNCPNDKGAYDLACIDCGATCCPSCAVPLESVTYCRNCARSLLGAPTVQAAGSFDLH